jgi:hypothetical protein
MWKMLITCLLLTTGCRDWKHHPDEPVEEFIEAAIEEAVEQGARSLGIEIEVKFDFTPESPEPTVRSEGIPEGD